MRYVAAVGSAVQDNLVDRYDAGNGLVFASNGGGAHQYTLNPLGQAVRTDEPANSWLTGQFDAAGNRVLLTDDAGGSTASDYDSANRLIARTQTTGNGYRAQVVLKYDQGDHLTRVLRWANTPATGNQWVYSADTFYQYDAYGRLLAEQDYLPATPNQAASSPEVMVTDTEYGYTLGGRIFQDWEWLRNRAASSRCGSASATRPDSANTMPNVDRESAPSGGHEVANGKTNGGIRLEDIRITKDLVGRVGAGQLRALIDLLA